MSTTKHKKRLIIDLSILRHLYCGLGQVAWNFGKCFETYFQPQPNLEVCLLVPPRFVGTFGHNVRYIKYHHILRMLYHQTPCLVLPHFDLWHAIFQNALFPYQMGGKMLLTIHDLNFLYEKSDKAEHSKRLERLQRRIDKAAHIVCISNYTITDVQKYVQVHNKPLSLIYNGVEIIDPSNERQPIFAQIGQRFFFSIGEVRPKKNFHTIVEMMKHMPDYQLYIAGNKSTEYAQQIQKIIANKDIKNAHLIGFIAPEERTWLYHHCSAFLFPSLFEGFGLPIIEAMQFGKPVCISRSTSLPEIGGKHAFYWDNFEPEAMAQTVQTAIQTMNDTQRVEQEIAYARTFSYQHNFEQYLNIYLNLLR